MLFVAQGLCADAVAHRDPEMAMEGAIWANTMVEVTVSESFNRRLKFGFMSRVKDLILSSYHHALSIDELFEDSFLCQRLMASKVGITKDGAKRKLLKHIDELNQHGERRFDVFERLPILLTVSLPAFGADRIVVTTMGGTPHAVAGADVVMAADPGFCEDTSDRHALLEKILQSEESRALLQRAVADVIGIHPVNVSLLLPA